MSNFYKKKAKYAKSLYDKGLPFVKVYATCEDENEFLVLKKTQDDKVTYHLAGGGVEKHESLKKAIIRELKEELGVKVEVIRELGVYDKIFVTFEYEGEKFDIQYEIHVFETKCIKKINRRFGLKGEFDNKMQITKINKQTMLDNVDEFRTFGIKFDN